MKSDSVKINKALEIDGSTIGQKILSIDTLIEKNNKIITTISTTSSKIIDKVEVLTEDPLLTLNQMKEELGKVETSLGNLSSQISDFAKLRDSINAMILKMNKMKQGSGILSSLFGGKKNSK